MSPESPKRKLDNYNKNKVKLVCGGKEFFELIVQLINNATESIHLQTYIFNDDETGVLVAEALKSAARRNVQVYLLADGYASQGLSGGFIADLKESGIQFRFYEPFFRSKSFYFGRRMHHKLFVVDSKIALTGGINIADRYNDLPGYPCWLDFALMVEGPVARDLCILCWKTWYNFPRKLGLTPCERTSPVFDFEGAETSLVRMRRNDWVRRKNEVSGTYIEMFLTAQSHITILCSYFLPGKVIRRLLRNATRRGVKVTVVTAGTSDVMIAKHAERWMYDWLLRNKINLFEYQKTVLHAKLAVSDTEWMTLGSYNLNDLSTYASIELNLDVKDPAFAAKTEKHINKIIEEECVPVELTGHRHAPNVFVQFLRWASYFSIRFVFRLFTFYYKHRK